MSTPVDWYRSQAETYGEDAACLMLTAPTLSAWGIATATTIAREAGHYGRLVQAATDPEWFPGTVGTHYAGKEVS